LLLFQDANTDAASIAGASERLGGELPRHCGRKGDPKIEPLMALLRRRLQPVDGARKGVARKDKTLATNSKLERNSSSVIADEGVGPRPLPQQPFRICRTVCLGLSANAGIAAWAPAQGSLFDGEEQATLLRCESLDPPMSQMGHSQQSGAAARVRSYPNYGRVSR
jgi:hypothetical protein